MNEKVLQNELVKSFVAISTCLPDMFDEEVSFAVADTEKYLIYKPTENINPGIKPGDPVGEGSSSYVCMKTGKTVKRILPKHVIGIELMSAAIPIKDENGQVIGCVSFGRSLRKNYQIADLANTLSASLQQVSSATNQLTASLQNVLVSNEEVMADADRASEEAKNTDSILKFIKGIANKTNMLGLNASIEAAKANEAGKGFSVVAQEIRKLSNSSNESINKIQAVLDTMLKSIERISTNIGEVNLGFKDQAQVLTQINDSIQNLNSVAKKLQEISEI